MTAPLRQFRSTRSKRCGGDTRSTGGARGYRHIHNLGCPWRRQEVVHSHRPASLPQHARAGRERRAEADGCTKGVLLLRCPRLEPRAATADRWCRAQQSVRCEFRAHRPEGDPRSSNTCPSWPHSISAVHTWKCSAPRQRALALRGVGPVVLPMVRNASEVPRRRGLLWMCPLTVFVDVPPHCQAGHQRWNVLLL